MPSPACDRCGPGAVPWPRRVPNPAPAPGGLRAQGVPSASPATGRPPPGRRRARPGTPSPGSAPGSTDVAVPPPTLGAKQPAHRVAPVPGPAGQRPKERCRPGPGKRWTTGRRPARATTTPAPSSRATAKASRPTAKARVRPGGHLEQVVARGSDVAHPGGPRRPAAGRHHRGSGRPGRAVPGPGTRPQEARTGRRRQVPRPRRAHR